MKIPSHRYYSLLFQIEEQRSQLLQHVSTSTDIESVAIKHKSVKQYFDEFLTITSKDVRMCFRSDKAFMCLPDGRQWGRTVEDKEFMKLLKEMDEQGQLPKGKALASFLLTDDEYLSHEITMDRDDLMQKHGLESGVECLALMGIAENKKAELFFRFVKPWNFLKPWDFMRIPATTRDMGLETFVDADAELQVSNMLVVSSSLMKAGEYLARINSWLVTGMADKDQIVRKARSKEAYKAAMVRHEPTNRLKKYAINLYEISEFRSQSEAARKIAKDVREWAEENDLRPLSRTNDVETIKKWIRQYRKELEVGGGYA